MLHNRRLKNKMMNFIFLLSYCYLISWNVELVGWHHDIGPKDVGKIKGKILKQQNRTKENSWKTNIKLKWTIQLIPLKLNNIRKMSSTYKMFPIFPAYFSLNKDYKDHYWQHREPCHHITTQTMKTTHLNSQDLTHLRDHKWPVTILYCSFQLFILHREVYTTVINFY